MPNLNYIRFYLKYCNYKFLVGKLKIITTLHCTPLMIGPYDPSCPNFSQNFLRAFKSSLSDVFFMTLKDISTSSMVAGGRKNCLSFMYFVVKYLLPLSFAIAGHHHPLVTLSLTKYLAMFALLNLLGSDITNNSSDVSW